MQLQRKLGLIGVISIASGSMLSGLFILPGLGYAISGPGLLGSFILAGFLAVTGMLSQAELASAMPKAGGAYFFVSRSMGPSVGTVYGLITWLSLCLKSAVELVAVAIFASLFFSINQNLIAVGICVTFLCINLVGVHEAGKIQTVLVLLILAALGIYVMGGVRSINVQHFEPFTNNGMHGIVAGAGFIFVSFGGLLKIASIAEDVRNPGKILPKGMILSLMLISVVYLTVLFITIGVVSPAELTLSKTPISLGALAFMGSSGQTLFHIVAIASIVTAANAGIMSASRYPLALSRDGLLPEIFSAINHRFHTPHLSIMVTGLLIIMALFFRLNLIVKAASSVLILTYAFSCISIIIMRESRLQNYQPHFFCPFYPWVQIIGILGFGFLLYQISVMGVTITLGIMAVGALSHWYYGKTGVNKEFALLHLIERVTEREYTEHVLETELKHIIHERDNITKDTFDHMIEDCVVLDIDHAISREDLFEMIADTMAESLGVKKARLQRKLLEREEESSTVLSPFLAIPHVIIRGKNIFEILIVRNKEGINFSETFPQVHAVFALLGSRDTRHLHLQALAAIAQIFQRSDFEKRWLEAKNVNSLRDMILLSKRKRHTPLHQPDST